jgi:hypothetical protein
MVVSFLWEREQTNPGQQRRDQGLFVFFLRIFFDVASSQSGDDYPRK